MLKVDSTVLVVIDIQGKLLNVMHEKEALLENAQKLIKGIRLLGVPVIVTEQNPRGLGPTQPELAQLLPDVPPLPKFCFSCSQDQGFADTLKKLDRRQVLICGIEAHICVYQTALELLGERYKVQIVADVVSSRTARNRDIALSRLQEEGARLTSVEMVLFELLRTSENPNFKEISRIIK
ncbi:MAG TPA: hydrolase [Dehalococcoidales bacterium]|nr:hydrolase [Dehalococcoidales bacterium]